MGVWVSPYKRIYYKKVRIGIVSIVLPMDSENTLYHVMSLRGAERRSKLILEEIASPFQGSQ
jgi:hypothetical protein